MPKLIGTMSDDYMLGTDPHASPFDTTVAFVTKDLPDEGKLIAYFRPTSTEDFQKQAEELSKYYGATLLKEQQHMNYYLDQEFIEDFITVRHWPTFKKRKFHYTALISIGLVCEDGREYYAISSDFDLKRVWNKHDIKAPLQMGDEPEKVYWLRENILRPIWVELSNRVAGDQKCYTDAWKEFTYKNLKRLIYRYGKTNEQIAAEIRCFTAGVNCSVVEATNLITIRAADRANSERPPVFYGYYADYDWVIFCSLFGRMLDLPKGYPMYCRDLKQMFDNLELDSSWKTRMVPGDNGHHALEDARWNKKLHKELTILDMARAINQTKAGL